MGDALRMTRREIVERLAKERRVEQICAMITHLAPNDPDLADLSQHIYLILLEYREDMIQDLWRNNEINFLIVRLALNNFRSGKSRYHYLFRVFRERSVGLTGLDFIEE